MRINLHPRSDLAANVQRDLVAFLETGFDLHDIPVVCADLDAQELYHIPVVNDRNRGFRNSNIAWMIVLKFQSSQTADCVADVSRSP